MKTIKTVNSIIDKIMVELRYIAKDMAESLAMFICLCGMTERYAEIPIQN